MGTVGVRELAERTGAVVARGERGTPLDEAFALLDAEQPGEGRPAA